MEGRVHESSLVAEEEDVPVVVLLIDVPMPSPNLLSLVITSYMYTAGLKKAVWTAGGRRDEPRTRDGRLDRDPNSCA
jgi:hypothetical protein